MEYRKSIENVNPYVPGKSEEEIKKMYNLDRVVKIASNENPYGASKNVKNANIELLYNIYPDNYVTNLRNKLSLKYNIDKDNLAFGNGSVEIIQMLSRILLDDGDNIIAEIPSFSSYFSEAMIQGASIKTISYDENYSFDLAKIIDLIDNNTKMIYITNPNNPLGTIVTESEINNFLDRVPKNILVVVDEAYAEFVRDNNYKSCIDLIKKYSNVCVLRTFSKAYGLAALRIGYIVASKEVVNELEKVRVPFNVSTLAQKCAEIALEDSKHIECVREKIHKTIDYMYQELDRNNIEYIKTQANFIMINVNKSSRGVVQKLLEKGFIVRDGFPLMDTWIRVSIGTQEEMQDFMSALVEAIK